MAELRVNVILSETDDRTTLEERLRNYANRSQELVVRCTTLALPEFETDCYATSFDRVRELTFPKNRPSSWKPTIAFGPPGRLRNAFLDGCADYLKEPWTPEELYFRVLKNCRSRTHQFSWGSLEVDGLTLRIRFNEPAAESPETESPAEREALLHVTRRQMAIFEALLALRGTIVTREILFYAMWGRAESGSRAVDMQVHEVRASLGRVAPMLGEDRLIKSTYGAGYLIS